MDISNSVEKYNKQYSNNYLANFIVLKGEKKGEIIPYVLNGDQILNQNLGISSKLIYDKENNVIFIQSENMTINKEDKIKSILNDGDIIEIGSCKLRFYYEKIEHLFDSDKFYSPVFFFEHPFLNKDVFYFQLRNEFSRSKRYHNHFSVIFLKFMNYSIRQISDILAYILKENLRDTDYISDISENDLLITLPMTKMEDGKKAMEKIIHEVLNQVDDLKILENVACFEKEMESYNQLFAAIFDI